MAGPRKSEERPDVSKIDNRAPSVPRMFLNRVAATPNAEAFRYPENDGWTSVTWAQVGERVELIAAGLIALGINPEDRVALASGTRYEWVIVDFGILAAGAATTTVYPSTNAEDTAFIVANSGSRVVVAENQSQVDKLTANRADLPAVEKVVIIDGTSEDDWVITLDELEQLGKQLLADQPTAVTDRIDAIPPEQLATLIYTSGTTGKPKGVRLHHEAWTYTAAALDSLNVLSDQDLNYLWLPLAHSFGKVMLAMPLLMGFPTVIDGRVDKIVENLAVIKPTFMGAVPRIFEKVHGRITETMAEEGGAKKRLFDWASDVGLQVSRARQAGHRVGPLLALQHKLADRLVFNTIRQRFGGRLRFFISGSAALDRDIAQWFDAVGAIVLEGYGLTETSAASSLNRLHAYRFGTVGWTLPYTDVKIAGDGEVLLKGPGVMSGYHDLPEATAEAIDSDGWFHTGDIGELDAEGFLRITDRKKDMFKTSQGKYVAPSAISAVFKGICPFASEIIIYGEGKPYCVALVSLDAEAIREWADRNGMEGKSFEEVARDEKTRAMVEGYVETLNKHLNRWEQVKRFAIIDRELTVEAGDLTPSLKLKRKAVVENFHDNIDELYG
ncbi:long-chain fatty acid--CoA ligase [Mycobacterium crocinum]|uniref:Long-chain fatty acid--CoA ligase n=1 Tax=Mycolicibacterium crocinum TaxID=388459 RepID=A0ABY3TXQ4_9MYCO|nr:long-chain fatty acid--CoA ligase [Mycolicibacterium crocinum]MCV7218713.1 long-chain fatty acid--CoA ligase [Mycolicibacterium crocinum]ULN43880.1 long-chain fatty acid--CoA ligase [Mycolicibacterium crocinum]